ncbi:40S ribosomal protein S19 [Candidatus Micrarchaeota archaeon]|nr:40S ribosomal protein S19 [Candidatus Micrarchaeota archaeon]MBI5177545.1 40S ribosomal protein S19 [Candidatus Micrarchaeota archaeon]
MFRLKDAVLVLAEDIKSVPGIVAPEWVQFVKSGSHNERLILEPDFWFKRCASLLFQLDEGTVGVRSLRHKYGAKNQHTVSRSHHRVAGGKIIRVALQQLEKAGLAKKEKIGRVIAPAGRALVRKAVAKALAS